MHGRQVPFVILEHWYVCGRKTKYATREIAYMVIREQRSCWFEVRGSNAIVRSPYECPKCLHWHIGRPIRNARRLKRVENHQTRRDHYSNMIKAWNEHAYRDQDRD